MNANTGSGTETANTGSDSENGKRSPPAKSSSDVISFLSGANHATAQREVHAAKDDGGGGRRRRGDARPRQALKINSD